MGKAPRYRMGQVTFHRLMRHPKVRAKCRAVARRIASRAEVIEGEGDQTTDTTHHHRARITVESGMRPKGRSYSRVVSDDAAGEFGNDKTPRRAVLRRAANQ